MSHISMDSRFCDATTQCASLSDELLPFLREIDFECTNEKSNQWNHTIKWFENNGRFYEFSRLYLSKELGFYRPRALDLVDVMELRVRVYSSDPQRPRLLPFTMESCFVYATDGVPDSCFNSYRTDMYALSDYKRTEFYSIRCFYCGKNKMELYKHLCDETFKHRATRERVINDLAEVFGIPGDCVCLILSHLEYTDTKVHRLL
jgi:DNA-directed RNA polymerase subunit N (RpoN/RPB10)